MAKKQMAEQVARADFYIGIDGDAEWLGSIVYDGNPETMGKIFRAKTKKKFRKRVAARIAGVDHGTTPDQGWPWPWATSMLSDYAYAWHSGVYVYNGGASARATTQIASGAGRWIDGKLRNGWVHAEEWMDALERSRGRSPSQRCTPEIAFPADFPNMSGVQRVTWGRRSGMYPWNGQ